MTPVLDGPAPDATDAAGDGRQHCPECLAAYDPIDARQIFCSQAHRRAWNNRWVTRGAVMAPLAAVARLTRNGSRGRGRDASIYGARAGRDVDVLLRRWQAEDQAAGRMAWESWLARRYGSGFDPV